MDKDGLVEDDGVLWMVNFLGIGVGTRTVLGIVDEGTDLTLTVDCGGSYGLTDWAH